MFVLQLSRHEARFNPLIQMRPQGLVHQTSQFVPVLNAAKLFFFLHCRLLVIHKALHRFVYPVMVQGVRDWYPFHEPS